MDLILGLDIANQTLRNPTDGSPLNLPPLVQGDQLNIVLKGMQMTPTGGFNFVPISFKTIKLGIGKIDAAPLQGTYALQIGSETPVQGTNTTPALLYNSSKSFVQTALNALPAVSAAGGLTVVKDGAPNILWIIWNDPAVNTSIHVVHNELFPTCFTRSIPWTINGQTAFIVKLFQAPVAFTDKFALPTSPAVTVAEALTGNDLRNEIQKIEVPATAQGDFTMTWNGLGSTVIPVASVTAVTIAAALNNLFSDGITRFQVIQPAKNYYYVTFTGPLGNAFQPLIQITMVSQPPLITPSSVLNLNVPGIEIALDGQPSVPMMFELEINDGTQGTPIQVPVTIKAAMIDSEMALVVSPNWLVNQGYVSPPNNSDQATVAGLIGYQEQVGDTVNTSWNISHMLGSQDVFVEVIENSTGVRLPDNQYTATITDSSHVLIVFPSPPATDQYRVLITSAYATNYLPHLHLHIGDIDGLQDALNALAAQGNPLDLWPSIPLSKLPKIPFSKLSGTLPVEALPSTVPQLDNNGFLPVANVPPSVPRLAADGSLVVAQTSTNAQGVTTITGYKTILNSDGTIAPELISKIGSIPAFISAVRAVLAGQGQTIPVNGMKIPLGNKAEVIGYTGSPVTADPFMGYVDSQLPNRAISLQEASNFDRELWRIAVNASMFPVGKTLSVNWGLALQALRSNCAIETTVFVEIGTYDDPGSMLAITWNPTPIITQKVMLTSYEVTHSFGALISHTPTGMTLSTILYGVSLQNDEAAPSTANFALRCRLANLETEASQNDPRAWISYGVVPSLTASNGAAVAQALIS